MDQQINEAINKLFKSSISNKYIFVYTPPKVGSTTLVTSLRVSLGCSYNIIHIHDENMLKVLTGIDNVKINDILKFLSNRGDKVYVIDVYRTPIERKMSEFFEKLSPYHFNNTEENISNYSIQRIVDRFNKVFPHIENGDHYFDKYEIPEKEIPLFDFEKKYSIQERNNITYMKLRLCDSNLWANILSNLFKSDIVIIPDYKTEDKGIGELYKKFKSEYKLPTNYIKFIEDDKFFQFYYNENERSVYLESWFLKLNPEYIPYTDQEFKFYMNLCLENQYINDLQTEHYIDNGCACKFCKEKRREIYFKAKAGETHFEKIIHNEVINEVHNEKLDKISKKIKQLLDVRITRSKFKPKQFAIKISNK
jgi:hypothetical protein